MEFATSFDLDQTLIDSRPTVVHALRELAHERALAIVPGLFEAGIRGRLDEQLAEWYPDQGADRLAERFRELYRGDAMRLATPLPGAAEAIAVAREYGRVLVITGKVERNARLHLDELGWRVDAVVGWRHGPDKTATMREFGVSLYVGDQVEDMQAARAAEVVAVGVTTGPDNREALRSAGANHVLDSLADFPELLRLVAGRQETEPDPPPRPAARVVILDPADRILLVQFADPIEGRRWWCTPGGGLEDGETFEAAARRELTEETGLVDFRLGPWIWSREHRGNFAGRPFHAVERLYLVRTPAFEPTDAGYTQTEREVHKAMRWWTVEELEITDEAIAARRLACLLRQLMRTGAPAQPIDAGV